jgi:hypothetical protein
MILGMLAFALSAAGRRDEVQALLAELETRSQQEYVAALARAWIFSSLGDKPQTLEWLERGYEERNSMMLGIAAMADFDFLRGESRFMDLLQRMKLPVA